MMKTYPVLLAHNMSKPIGLLRIEESELPAGANYQFDIGGLIQENGAFQLIEVSLCEIPQKVTIAAV